MNNACHFSKDRRYRYALEHVIDPLIPSKRVAWIGLNPSTADESQLDPTLRRIRAFSQSWGFTSFVMLNLFALRSTDPRVMLAHDEPVGPENNLVLWQVARSVDRVVACWGAHGVHRDRAAFVMRMLTEGGVQVWSIGYNANGTPKHPLYVPAAAEPLPYPLREVA